MRNIDREIAELREIAAVLYTLQHNLQANQITGICLRLKAKTSRKKKDAGPD